MAVFSDILAAIELAERVAKMIKEGMSNEEIRQRLADPNGVGEDLIRQMRRRTKRIDDFKRNG